MRNSDLLDCLNHTKIDLLEVIFPDIKHYWIFFLYARKDGYILTLWIYDKKHHMGLLRKYEVLSGISHIKLGRCQDPHSIEVIIFWMMQDRFDWMMA